MALCAKRPLMLLGIDIQIGRNLPSVRQIWKNKVLWNRWVKWIHLAKILLVAEEVKEL